MSAALQDEGEEAAERQPEGVRPAVLRRSGRSSQ